MKRVLIIISILFFSLTFVIASIAVAQSADGGTVTDSQPGVESDASSANTAVPVSSLTTPGLGGECIGAWQTVASVNTARSRTGLAYLAATGNFYMAGGEATGGNRNNPIEEYDPVANTWTNRANLLTGVSNSGAAGVGSYVYIPGGYTGGSGIPDMQRYDPVANTVITMTAMPAANFAHAVTALDNKIYVLGGSGTGAAGTTNFIYDIGTDSWIMGTPLITAVQYPAAATDGTYIYVLGGNTTNLSTAQRYNPGTDTWDAIANMNSGRGGPGAFFDGTNLWAVGGGWTTYLTSTEYFDGAAWQPGSGLNVGARTIGAAYGNGMALKAAGWNGSFVSAAEMLLINCPPVANPDVFTTTENVTLEVPAPGVLANDFDDGGVLTAVLDIDPTYGALTFNGDGSFTYTPTQNFYGTDGFTYYVTDGLNNSNSAEVTIWVTAVNEAPIANDDFYSATQDTPLVVSAPGVLANDVDNDGLHLYTVSGGGNDDLLREIDPLTGATIGNIQLTHAGGMTINRGVGLATHPQTGVLYGILRLEGQTGRELVTIDPTTGIATSIGNTQDAFAAIVFDDTGVLYGVTGDGATISETLFTLDTTTAISTMVTPLGNGDDGEALGFNPDDGLLYHASGHTGDCPPGDLGSCVVFETIDRTAPYTITDIPISGTVLTDEEAQALVYWQGGFLWKQNHGTGPLYWVTTDGTPTLVGDVDHQAKGMAFVVQNLTAVLDTNATNGSVILNADGSFTYTPNSGFCGTSDSFTYYATDGLANSNIAVVTIEVECTTSYIYLPIIIK
jgi:hypothetical protein